MKPLPLLQHLLMLGLAASTGQSLRASEPPLAWGDQVWQLQTDPASGALVHLENRNDAQHMNWLREAGRWDHGKWLPDASPGAMTLDGRWGLVETAQTGLLQAAQVHQLSDRAWEAVYTGPSLTVTARHELEDETGVVYGAVGRQDSGRLYNFPWVAHFHLAMYRATGDADRLDRFVRVIRI